MLKDLRDLVEAYLSRYGWTYESVGEDEWRTGFCDDVGTSFRLNILATKTYLRFELSSGDSQQSTWLLEPDWFERLLRLNLQMNGASVALNAVGDVVLVTSLLTTQLSYETFVMSLEILAHYGMHQFADLSEALVVSHYS